MKKIFPVLNVVLLVAVVVLYILHFMKPTNNSTTAPDSNNVDLATISAGDIVYIDIDSVINNLTMSKDLTAQLESKAGVSEAQLQSKQAALEKAYKDYQYKMERGLIMRSEAAELQQKLQRDDQELRLTQQQLQYELAEKQQVSQRKIMDAIMVYLEEQKDAGKYKYVLGNILFSGNLMYADQSLNITKSVIEGLNAKYAAEQAE